MDRWAIILHRGMFRHMNDFTSLFFSDIFQTKKKKSNDHKRYFRSSSKTKHILFLLDQMINKETLNRKIAPNSK